MVTIIKTEFMKLKKIFYCLDWRVPHASYSSANLVYYNGR